MSTAGSGGSRELPRVGSEFAGYLLDGMIARGGMGVLFRGENRRLGNRVALKILAAELSDDDVFRERFVRESRTAAAISHPNIIPIYDAGECDGLLYIVMRYVAGSDLKALLRTEHHLNLAHTIDLLGQLCRAVHAAHQQQLIHRDIKPGNVLIERAEGDASLEHVYLADFGLTKHALSRSGITQTGEFLGTIDYVAPEQIEGRHVDGRTDVYSLGCLLYEMLTGEVPFPRESEAAILWAHMRDTPPSVRALRPELPPGVDDTIRRATAKHPEDRYVGALELIAALIDVARNAPAAPIVPAFVNTRPSETPSEPSASSGSGAPASANLPAEAAAASVAGSSASAGTPASTHPEAIPTPTAPGTPTRSRRTLRLSAAAAAIVVIAAVALALVLLTRGSHSSAGPPSSGKTKPSVRGVQAAVPGALWSQWGCKADAEALPPAIPGNVMVAPAGTVTSSATCSFKLQRAIPVAVRLASFDSAKDMTAIYDHNLTASHVPPESGPCGANTFHNESVWHHGGEHGVVAGRKFCFFSRQPQQAVIVWMLTMAMGSGMGGRNILAVAGAPAANHEALLAWWQQYRHQIGEGA